MTSFFHTKMTSSFALAHEHIFITLPHVCTSAEANQMGEAKEVTL